MDIKSYFERLDKKISFEEYLENTLFKLDLLKNDVDLRMINYLFFKKTHPEYVGQLIKHSYHNCNYHYMLCQARLLKDYKSIKKIYTISNQHSIIKERNKLIKEGKDPIESEKYLIQKYKIDTDININMFIIEDLYKKIKIFNEMNKIGRPRLSNSKKEESKIKNKMIMRDKMKKKYEELKKFTDNLFSKEEEEYIRLHLNQSDKDIYEKVMKKVSKFTQI